MKPPIVIQNADIAVGSKWFEKNVPEGQLLVTSIFATIQGEGPLMGHPALFIRLAGCDFGNKARYCQFCDTSFQVAQGRLYTPEALMDAAIKVAVNARLSGWSWEWPPVDGPIIRRLIITGGEPLLQTPSLAKFFKVVHDFDPRLEVQIETNGTVFPEDKLSHNLDPIFVVSPKGVYSDTPSQKLPYPDGKYLHRWVYGSKDYSYGLDVYFKFVVESDSTSPHHDVTPDVLKNFDRSRTFVSPMAVYARPYSGEVADAWEPGLLNVERTRANYRHAADLCMKYGTTLSIQQHLFTAQP